MQKYKKIIDKHKLQEFCLGYEPIDSTHIEALNLLATVVIMKEFPTLRNKFKELKQFLFQKACEVRHNQRFNPEKQNAYNFLYTVFYHDIQNKIWKYSKEPNFEDIVSVVVSSDLESTDYYDSAASVRNPSTLDDETFDTFKEISEYVPYLSCSVPFVKKRIPTKDVLNLLLFLRMHEKKLLTHVKLPGFVADDMDSDATRALYKICSDLITLFDDGTEGDDNNGND